MKNKKRKFPKPKVIFEIPIVEIDGETWGIEVSKLSEEETIYLKKKQTEKKLNKS